MTYTAYRNKTTAVRVLSLFFCAVFLLLSYPVMPVGAVGAPLMYINDTVFPDWQTTPVHTINGTAYIPITMFIDLDAVYYYSNPGVGTFYIQNETTEEYLSFSLKAINDAYNGKGIIKIDIQVFHDTIYLPAIETANHLGLFVEMNSDNTVIRLSDSTAKMPFTKLLELYNPIIETPGDEKPPVSSDDPTPVAPPDTPDKPPVDNPPTEKPPEPVIIPCDLYMCYTDPQNSTLDDLITALESRDIPATFFLSNDYIKSYPQNVVKLYSQGYSIGIYCRSSGFETPEEALESICSANSLLRKITKKKTRIITLSYENDALNKLLEQNGFNVHSFNIHSPSNPAYSGSVASAVTSALPGVSTAKILMASDMYSVSAVYEIGRFINSHDIIKKYTIDETVQ